MDARSGAVAELYCPVPTIDDNLFVPIATAAAVSLFLHSQGTSLEYLPGPIIPGLPFPPNGIFTGTAVAAAYAALPTAPFFA
jgi:hypothetical protein